MPRRAPHLLAALIAAACSAGDLDDDGGLGGTGGADAASGSGDGDGGGPGLGDAGPFADADPAAGLGYAEARFSSTHNSYSGDINGERGTILAQLEAGVRNLELDIYDSNFAAHGYRVGHNSPGGEVDRGDGNPETDAFTAWLEVIGTWSAQNPRHAPITVLVDLKSNISSNHSYAQGEPARLNDVLLEAFGDRLLRAEEVGDPFPTIPELRGRILAVMSGSETTRMAYRRDRGHNAAVAVNAHGQVVEVHDSGGGDLWYWTGQIENGYVRWIRHGMYDTGRNPAVALSDDGLIVEVHNGHSGSDTTLWYGVGQLGDDYEIEWLHDGGQRFPDNDQGINPSIRFVDRGGLAVREIHQSQNNPDNHFYWNGTIDVGAGEVVWTREGDGDGDTNEPLFDKTADATGGHAIAVSTGELGPYGSDTLRYRLSDGPWRFIRYEQVLFVEAQHNGSAALEADELWFYAASAERSGGRSWAEDRRAQGGVVRLWNFNSPDHATRTPVNFPATDFPFEDWYRSYCEACVR